MNTLLFCLLTATVIALAAWFGAANGGRQLLRGIAILGIAWLLAIGAATFVYQRGWFRPLGLLTPVAAGLSMLVSAGFLLRRRWPRPARAVPTGDRNFGFALGSAIGVLLAAEFWLLTGLAAGFTAGQPTADAVAHGTDAADTGGDGPQPLGDLLHSLARTANRGFVRHLPLFGGLGDEVEATLYILNAPGELRHRFTIEQSWQELTQLPSYAALLADQELAADLREFRDGSLLALYRVQQNPRFLSFFTEQQVQALLPGLRPTVLAERVRAVAAAGRSTTR